jgi:GT2 family glycosyltransferase
MRLLKWLFRGPRQLEAQAERRNQAEESSFLARREWVAALREWQVRYSPFWRIAAVSRSVDRIWYFLRPPRSYNFHLLPNRVSFRSECAYADSGSNPQLSLVARDGRWPRDWTVFRCVTGHASAPSSPRLHADYGRGYHEEDSWSLASMAVNEFARAIYFPETPIALRIDFADEHLDPQLLSLKVQSGGLLWLSWVVVRYAISNAREVSNLDHSIRAASRSLLSEGWREFIRKMKRRSRLFDENEAGYLAWIRLYDRLGTCAQDALTRRLKHLARAPLFSVLMPVYDPPANLLKSAIDSVKRQIYGNWQLCIADDGSRSASVRALLEDEAAKEPRIRLTRLQINSGVVAASNAALRLAGGDYIALLDHDDELAPHSLAMMALEIAAHPQADVLYSDEDKIDLYGRRYEPYFKPDWNPDLFLAQNYLNHLSIYRHTLVRSVGGFREGMDGSQDYDLALRVIEQIPARHIRHVPQILYHWRAARGSTALASKAKPFAQARSIQALQEYFARSGINAAVTSTHAIYHRVSWPLPPARPLVSLIMLTRDNVEMLRPCVESIRQKTTYAPWELIVVDNGSRERETLEYLKNLTTDPHIRVLCDDAPFNYAAINNRAVTIARGSVLGFLNNDLEVIEGGWLTEMVSHALRPGIGVVGARLLYPNGRIQHAGIVLGIGGVAGHIFRFAKRDHGGDFGRAQLTQDFSAVTAACMIVPKAVFQAVGGFDATNLPIAFNDVDFCLRVKEAGYRIVCTPYAELLHHESASRGLENTPQKRTRFHRETLYMQKRWQDYLITDPNFNPNLSLDSEIPVLSFPPRQVSFADRFGYQY